MAEREPPALSVVSPVYLAEPIVDELVARLIETLDPLNVGYEIILVDDRSPDASWERIAHNCELHPAVRGIRLSRNVGQHRAIMAGLAAARGEHVVVMDCDLQDNPKYIPDMLSEAERGAAIVYTQNIERQHSWFRNVMARAYFALLGATSGDRDRGTHQGTSAYSMLSRRVVDEYLRIRDAHSHYLLNLAQLGFTSTTIEVEHSPRHAGRSSYTFSRLVRHAADGITSSSARLLNVSIAIGLILFVISILGAAALVVGYFLNGALPGYTSLMVIVLLSTGMILMSIGVLGVYIGRIFEQVKDRPAYIVEQTLNPSDG